MRSFIDEIRYKSHIVIFGFKINYIKNDRYKYSVVYYEYIDVDNIPFAFGVAIPFQ